MKTSLWFRGLTFVIAAVAFCLAWFRCEPIQADWVSILVGTLAILVTALIGWQVYNVVDLKTTSKKLDIAIKTSTELNNELNNFKIYVDAEFYCNNAYSLYILKLYMDAIEQYIKALQMYARIENYEQKKRDVILGIYVCIANLAILLIRISEKTIDFINEDDKKTYKRIMNILQSNRPNFESLISVNEDIKDLFDIMKTTNPNIVKNKPLDSKQIEYITEIYNRNNRIVNELLE